MQCFALIGHLVPQSKESPLDWPGDDVEVNRKDGDAYAKMAERRLSKLKRFARSDISTETVLKACISSMPRWRYMRELEKARTPPILTVEIPTHMVNAPTYPCLRILEASPERKEDSLKIRAEF